MTASDRLLAILRTGGWQENLYQRTGMMVHSRVADLRKRGHRIECKRFGPGDFRYRLVESR